MTSNGVGCGVPSTGPIPSAISAALKSNISLQAELKRRLLKTRCAQVQNRRDAARVAASISRCWNDNDVSECSPKDGDDGNETLRKNESNSKSTQSSGVNNTGKVTPEFTKKWVCNPNRRGTRGFFTDPNGSAPEKLLSDIVGNNETETDPLMAQTARVIFERNESQIPCREPQKTWQKTKRKNWPTDSFDEVTLRIDRSLSRSDDECHTASFTFADSRIAKAKFSKRECLFIMSMVSKSGGETQKDIDWYEMAMQLHSRFKCHTPWQCFSHYRSSLQNPSSRCSPWTPDEDELLLKYLAVHGAQYLHQGDTLVQICRNLFPLRNTKQLAVRAHSTLINPNYVQDAWSADEKRTLALLMRAYSNEQSPINFAARMMHFSQRAPKSVGEKWIKTLDPAVSYRPFTPDEDEELHESSGQWCSVGKKFPKRSGDSLKRRWAELADEKTVAKHCENRLINKAFAKGGGITYKGKSILSPKDFVVLPQSKVSRPKQSKSKQNMDT